jgi:hypothetical protein
MDKDKRHKSHLGNDAGLKHAKKDHVTGVKTPELRDESAEKKDDLHEQKRRRDTL